jgi:hypothetical protein
VVSDGGEAGTSWDNVLWSASVPAGAVLAVGARASESEAGLAGQAFTPASNGAGIALVGRYLEVKVDFAKSSITGDSPVLFDLTVQGENGGGEPSACVTADRRAPGSLLLFPEFSNEPGVLTLLTVTDVDCNGGEELAVEFVYIDGESCAEFNRTELMTPCDTLSVLTMAHSPNSGHGFVYAFVKDPSTGEPMTSNTLIGQAMILSGLDSFEYAMNAVSFQGVPSSGSTDLDGDGLRDLDGVEYAQAPDSLLVPRFLGQDSGASGVQSELILIGLSGGARFETTVDLLIYNDDEEVFSAEHSFACWEKRPLVEVSGIFAQSFLRDWTSHDPDEVLGAAGRESGWFRIEGAMASSATTSIPAPAVYAVLVERVGPYAVSDLPFELCSQSGGVLLPRSLTGE